MFYTRLIMICRKSYLSDEDLMMLQSEWNAKNQHGTLDTLDTVFETDNQYFSNLNMYEYER
jgi:hypothetical protein